MRKYSLESFNAGHFFEALASEDSFYCKKFFGGLSIYVFGRMVAFLSEHPGEKEWRGKSFKIEVWNGCLIPSHREHHDLLLKKIKGTVVHPVISKWLYLPQSEEQFETSMFQLVEMIENKSGLIGVEPEMSSGKKARK